MKTRFAKFLALAMAMLMIVSAFAGCGKQETPDTPDTDGEQNETPDNSGDKVYEDAGKIVITDTFYPQYPEVGEYDEMKAKLKKWFDESLENGNLFSAKIGEDEFETVFARMTKDVKRTTNEDGDEFVTAIYKDEASHLELKLEATLYGHSPSVDYIIHLTNTSDTENTPVISDLNVLDSNFEMKSAGGYTINTNKGTNENIDDFAPIIEKLSKSSSKKDFQVSGGQSCNSGAFPYFDVIGRDEGLIMAIGWSGNWKSSFEFISAGEFSMKASQKVFNAVLLPGETVRTPSMVMTYFTGDEEYGHNIWRRLVISDYMPPTDDPEGFKAPMCVSTWGRTVKGIKEYLPYYNDSVVDIFFIDAGWYSQGHPPRDEYGTALQWDPPHRWYDFLGDWSENKLLYPKGMKEVADFVHENTDMKFMLWWMIEDGMWGVKDNWTFDPSNYIEVKNEDGTYANGQIIDLSRDEVADMLIDYFSKYIDETGIDYIRVDKYTWLEKPWTQRDAARCAEEGVEAGTREGITEAKYIANFYRIWDTLYEKYPGFFLDNCCSGGRRLDIEMTKRGYPLWRTDYSGSDEAHQAMTQYLAKWVPLNCVGNVGSDEYAYRSKYSANNIIGIANNEETAKSNIKTLEEFDMLSSYWYGDYYQLLPENRDDSVWQAYQLYREDWQEGMVVTIRRPAAAALRQTIKLEGLMEDREYTLHNIDEEGTENDIVMTGKQLMEEGITVTQDAKTIDCYIISLNRIDTDVIR